MDLGVFQLMFVIRAKLRPEMVDTSMEAYGNYVICSRTKISMHANNPLFEGKGEMHGKTVKEGVDS